MKNTFSLFTVTLFSLILICSCTNKNGTEQSGTSTDTAAIVENDTTPKNQMADWLWSFTMLNLPSPVQVLDEFARANLTADASLLNPIENASGYQSALKMSFNYGIYGVDLAYLVINSRAPEMIGYFTTTRKLAQNLNVGETFDQFTSRFEENKDNKDSLKATISSAMNATDSYLRSNERLITASEVLAGGWLEAQYITVSMLKDVQRTPENEMLYKRVWEQRFHLDNITKILDEFKDDPELMKIKNDFEQLLNKYKSAHESSDITQVYLGELADKLRQVRANIIK